MKKNLYTFLILILVIVGILIPASLSTPFSLHYATAAELESAVLASGVPGPESEECDLWAPSTWAVCIAFGVAKGILSIADFIWGLAALIFDFAVTETILLVSDWVKRMTFIDLAWTIFRDLANIFFIFVIIYIGIRTILGLGSGEMRRLLARVIIVGLLINFSLFFTKVIVDASNLVSVAFYTATTNLYPSDGNGSSGLYNAFADSFDLEGLRDKASSDPEVFVANWTNVFYLLFGAVFLTVASFIFISLALMFLIRFVTIIFLFILSPLAFVAYALPGMQGRAKEWWSTLTNQCIWPPVFFLFLYVLALMLQQNAYTFTGTTSDLSKSTNTGEVLASMGVLFMQFGVLITFLVYSVVAAKQAGASGSKYAMTIAGAASFGVAGLLGRQTLGRSFNAAAEKIKEKGWNTSRTGAMVFKGLQVGAKANYDMRGTPLGTAMRSAGVDAGKSGEGIFGTAKGGYAGYVANVTKKETEYAQKNLKTPAQKREYIEALRKKNPFSILTGRRRGELSAASTIEKDKGVQKLKKRDLETMKNSVRSQFAEEEIKLKTERDAILKDLKSRGLNAPMPNSDNAKNLARVEKRLSEINEVRQTQLDKIDRDIEDTDENINTAKQKEAARDVLNEERGSAPKVEEKAGESK